MFTVTQSPLLKVCIFGNVVVTFNYYNKQQYQQHKIKYHYNNGIGTPSRR